MRKRGRSTSRSPAAHVAEGSRGENQRHWVGRGRGWREESRGRRKQLLNKDSDPQKTEVPPVLVFAKWSGSTRLTARLSNPGVVQGRDPRALRCEVRPRGPPSRARLENNAMSPGVTLPVSDGGARSKRYGEGDWKAKAPHGELWDSIHKAPPQRGRTQVPKGSPMALGKETLVCTSAHCFCPVIIIIKG